MFVDIREIFKEVFYHVTFTAKKCFLIYEDNQSF